MRLDLGLHAAHLILQLASCTAERIVHREQGIGMPLVKFGRASHIDLATARKGHLDAHLVRTTLAVVLTRRLQAHMAGGYSAKDTLELCYEFRNAFMD
jgi:hypothetical protein